MFTNLLSKILAIFIVIAMMLTNCGFQGPLYLPAKTIASATTKTPSSSTKVVVSR